MKRTIQIALLSFFVSTTAHADFGDGGIWKMTPFGPKWDQNDWPEFTPMYWMEEMMNEFDDDDEDFQRFGPGSGSGYGPGNMGAPGAFYGAMPPGVNYQDWYEDESDWPEWTPMYWMDEFSNAFDGDDDNWNDRINQYQRYNAMPNPAAIANGRQFNMPAMPSRSLPNGNVSSFRRQNVIGAQRPNPNQAQRRQQMSSAQARTQPQQQTRPRQMPSYQTRSAQNNRVASQPRAKVQRAIPQRANPQGANFSRPNSQQVTQRRAPQQRSMPQRRNQMPNNYRNNASQHQHNSRSYPQRGVSTQRPNRNSVGSYPQLRRYPQPTQQGYRAAAPSRVPNFSPARMKPSHQKGGCAIQ